MASNDPKPAGDQTHSTAAKTPNGWLALLLSLVAGGAAWGLIQVIHPAFDIPEEFHVVAMGISEEQALAVVAAQERTDRNNATLYLAIVGALLAVGLAAARGRVLGAVVALPIGLALGALAGWGGSLIHASWSMALGEDELLRTMGVQAATLGILGIGVGLAFAAARPRRSLLLAATLAGLAAGAVAGALYPLGMSVVMPAIHSESLIPLEATSRLIWIALLAGLLGLIVPLATRGAEQSS